MPLASFAARKVAHNLPKVIGPRAHAVMDYVTAGTFLALGFMFWRSNKRAAIGAFMNGGAALANSLMTDYPGGIARAYSFKTHGKIDVGLAGLTMMTPDIFAFDDDDESKYFRMLGMMETGVTGMTDFSLGSAWDWEAEEAA
jgi:hypothetical protein